VIRCPACQTLHPSQAPCAACGYTPPQSGGFPAWAPELAERSSGFKPEYFRTLYAHEEANFWFRARNALIVWALGRYYPEAQTFLEVGCGTGFVLKGIQARFPRWQLTGTEIFTTGLAFAAERVPQARFAQLDARRMPFVEDFDVVGAFDVLEHIKEDEAALAGLYQALKPGGGLVLTVPQHPWLWSPLDEFSCHERRYRSGELHAKLRAAGFEVLRSTSMVAVLLPALLWSRRRMPPADQLDPCGEYAMHPALDRLLEAALTVERWSIRAGLNFPWGGTRLLVARKPLTKN
jgi:SAM-dependent methyltransferase